MKNFYTEILNRITLGESAVIAVITKCRGTTPRKAGAMMAVFSDGSVTGTIGGGSTEFFAIRDSKNILSEKSSLIKDYDIIESGNGSVTVLFKYIPSDGYYKEVFKNIITAFDENKEKYINFNIESAVSLDDTPYGLYSEPTCGDGKVYIFGGGHVAQKLAALLYELEFSTVIYEDREMFANRNFFPFADKIIFAPYEKITENISISPNDYAVIVTRGHLYDYECLKTAIKSGVKYIGIMGSRDKLKTAYTKLKEDGFSEKDFGRIFSPIGISIRSETPMEVAVSIAAQLIDIRAERKIQK